MKYVFISDYFQEIGGGEMVDARLREILEGEQVLIRAIDCTIEKLSKLKDTRIIVSNFTALSEECKKYLQLNCEYIIYEHDHKYLKTRNPSVFKDWKAPSDQLQNLDFYRAAKAVVCQTKQHQDVVILNTGLENTVNFGGSIWSEKQLQYLQEVPRASFSEEKIYAILDSHIVHKGTKQAIEYAKSKGFRYKLLEVKDWKDFISDLGDCTELLFLPQVLETCSRIAVEARMLGLRVLGNNNLSALKEDWFKEYKGKELIEYFRNKNKTLKDFIEKCFSFKVEVKNEIADITIILNLYKRPQNLQKQIDAFRNQTVKPKEIWVWQNCPNDEGFPQRDEEYRGALSVKGIDKWITSNTNWKYTGRFALANLAQTQYLCLADDDSLPGPEWLENALNTMQKHPGLMGGVGVVLSDDTYSSPHRRYGWPHPEHRQVEEVDLVGHSWVFRKEWLKYFWMEEPVSWETCEDLHFSYCLQKYGNIKTYVPIQDTKENTSSKFGYELGIDEVASSHPKNHAHFYPLRDKCVKEYLKRGWRRIDNGKSI